MDDEAWFSPRMIRTAQWLASFYLCSLAEMMRLFMPGKSGIHIEVLYRANPEEEHHVLLKMAMYGDVFFYLLKGGPRKKREIGRDLPQWKEQLTDILETGANLVFVVMHEGKEVLLPDIPDCILDVDTEKQIVKAHIMKGLLD